VATERIALVRAFIEKIENIVEKGGKKRHDEDKVDDCLTDPVSHDISILSDFINFSRYLDIDSEQTLNFPSFQSPDEMITKNAKHEYCSRESEFW